MICSLWMRVKHHTYHDGFLDQDLHAQGDSTEHYNQHVRIDYRWIENNPNPPTQLDIRSHAVGQASHHERSIRYFCSKMYPRQMEITNLGNPNILYIRIGQFS